MHPLTSFPHMHAPLAVNYCAILVLINSILQIAFFPLYLLLFVNDIGASHYSPVDLDYSPIAISVLIYLGIPLGAGAGTRLLGFAILGKERFEKRFLPYFGPLGLIGLLYTIIVLFAYQGERIIDHLGPVFRVFVPLVLYFVVMWAGTFVLVYYLSHKRGGAERFGYDMAVVQAFTAGSNNFEWVSRSFPLHAVPPLTSHAANLCAFPPRSD